MSKEKSKEYVVLQSIVGSKSVSFHPDFARALGSVPAGLFLSQGFFWQFNAQHIERITIEGKQYFSRTINEWETETALSEEQQKGARAILIKAGILTEKKAGLPARLYYSFDFDTLVAVIYGYKETGKQVSEDNRSKKRYLPRTSSGKIRRQEAVKYGDNYKDRDFNETLESLEREAQAPNSHPQPVEPFEPSNNPLQFEEEKKEKNTPPNSAPPPLKKEPRKKQSYTPDQVYELLPESVKPFFESVCQNGSLKTYLEYRRDQHKFSYNSATAAAIMIKSLYEFSGGDPDKAVLVVEQSIANGWKGIFKIKDSGQRKPAHIQNQQDLLSYVLANREKVWRESAGQ